MERIAEALPPFKIRLAGSAKLLYLLTTLIAEVSMVPWILVKGVNVPPWIERAIAAGIVSASSTR